MTIENRVTKLEEEVGAIQKEPEFILLILVEEDSLTHEKVEYRPTDEWIENAKKEAIEKDPGRSKYILYCSDKENCVKGTVKR